MNPFDVAAFAADLPAKLEKDERRIKLFLVAVQAKALSLRSDPIQAFEFSKGSAEIAWRFVSAGNPKKWGMDPGLIRELG